MSTRKIVTVSLAGIIYGTMMSSSTLAAGVGSTHASLDFRPVLVLLISLLLFSSGMLVALIAALKAYHPPTDSEISEIVNARRQARSQS